MTVAELKRRLVPGTKLTMVRNVTGPTPRLLRQVFERRSAECVMYVPEKDANSYLRWPKAAGLEETEKGFRIWEGTGSKRTLMVEYEWGWDDDTAS